VSPPVRGVLPVTATWPGSWAAVRIAQVPTTTLVSWQVGPPLWCDWDLLGVQVADGYNAPVSAGNFIDLVSRKFYDGLTIQRADGFIVQTGDPDGPVSTCCQE
jgi:Cyclophilin type peptidyl-prolyl cis-trans isomerase/CLD